MHTTLVSTLPLFFILTTSASAAPKAAPGGQCYGDVDCGFTKRCAAKRCVGPTSQKGALRKGLLEGPGQQVWPDGVILDGEFSGGLFLRGTMTYRDGTKREGEFKNLLLTGDGVAVIANRWTEQGYFKTGTLWKGTKTWIDGTKWEGEFEADALFSNGTKTWPDGTREVGRFHFLGYLVHGTRTRPDGTTESGDFEDKMSNPATTGGPLVRGVVTNPGGTTTTVP